VRDYEVVKVEQEVPNEFLLVFDEGDASSFITDGEARRVGAYYKVIERKMLLKKKRTEVCIFPPPNPTPLSLTPLI
jgi:RNA polymerase II-associated factor 1